MAPADFTTGARPVKAARGTELTAKSWQTEAPLRMLMNNLDPEVAERPDDLVVYGGTGRAVRSWAAFDAITRTLETMEKDETLLVQSGKPVGVFRTNEWAPRVLLANSNLVGRLGQLARVPPARGRGPDDVRPDDRRVLDLHRHPGHPAGHLRNLRRDRPQTHRRRERHPRRHPDAHRRLRRHGRRPAARRHAERRRLPDCRRRRDPPAPPRRQALPGRGGNRSRRRHRQGAQGQGRAPRLVSGLRRQRRRGLPGNPAPPQRRRAHRGHRHGPDLRARSAELPARRHLGGGMAPRGRGRP